MPKTESNVPQTRDPFQHFFQRLFGDSLAEFYGADRGGSLSPLTNIAETDHSYELSFELPGVEEPDIHVQMQDKTLTVTADRKEHGESKDRRWHRIEHRYGKFTRAIALPQDAASSGIEAVYQKGVLTVSVPKQPESRPSKINVRSA